VRNRLLSFIVLWGSVLGVLWFFRAPGALVTVTLLSALTLREFYELLRAAGHQPIVGAGVTLGALITAAPWIEPACPAAQYIVPVCVAAVACMALARPPESRVDALGSTLFGLLYVSAMLAFIVKIVRPFPGDIVQPDGRLLLGLWLIAVTKFCDVGALLSGMAFGRHKMAPVISPKKTWEGAIGGVLISAGIGALLAWFCRASFPAHFTPVFAALAAVPVAVLGVVSDLIESVIKRRANRKDSGNTIPGIGGVFDLTDSLILTAPIGFLLFGLD
jgi:phosphatidate cytidylyltransferase